MRNAFLPNDSLWSSRATSALRFSMIWINEPSNQRPADHGSETNSRSLLTYWTAENRNHNLGSKVGRPDDQRGRLLGQLIRPFVLVAKQADSAFQLALLLTWLSTCPPPQTCHTLGRLSLFLGAANLQWSSH